MAALTARKARASGGRSDVAAARPSHRADSSHQTPTSASGTELAYSLPPPSSNLRYSSFYILADMSKLNRIVWTEPASGLFHGEFSLLMSRTLVLDTGRGSAED